MHITLKLKEYCSALLATTLLKTRLKHSYIYFGVILFKLTQYIKVLRYFVENSNHDYKCLQQFFLQPAILTFSIQIEFNLMSSIMFSVGLVFKQFSYPMAQSNLYKYFVSKNWSSRVQQKNYPLFL